MNSLATTPAEHHDGQVHDDEVAIDVEQVVALVADQVPDLVGLPVSPVDAGGTVNTIFRIGETVTARFARRPDDPDRMRRRLRRGAEAASEVRDVCWVPSPEPLQIGRPGHGYPMPWSTQTWLPGSTATPTSDTGSTGLADDLIRLVKDLRSVDTRGRRFAGSGRGGTLSDHDDWVDLCTRRSEGLIDTQAMRSAWASFRTLPAAANDVMCHTDLIPANVLVEGGRLRGVLDTGGFSAADPALDLVAGWHLLGDALRERFRIGLGCSDREWERGRAWAFQQAAGAYWYYRDTNPAMAAMGRTTLGRVLDLDH